MFIATCASVVQIEHLFKRSLFLMQWFRVWSHSWPRRMNSCTLYKSPKIRISLVNFNLIFLMLLSEYFRHSWLALYRRLNLACLIIHSLMVVAYFLSAWGNLNERFSSVQNFFLSFPLFIGNCTYVFAIGPLWRCVSFISTHLGTIRHIAVNDSNSQMMTNWAFAESHPVFLFYKSLLLWEKGPTFIQFIPLISFLVSYETCDAMALAPQDSDLSPTFTDAFCHMSYTSSTTASSSIHECVSEESCRIACSLSCVLYSNSSIY